MEIPPFVQQIIGAVVRVLIVWIAARITAQGGPSFTDGQISHAVTEIVPLAAVLTWSIWQKYHGRIKLLTALSASIPMSEKQVENVAASGTNPPVNTPKNQIPSA